MNHKINNYLLLTGLVFLIACGVNGDNSWEQQNKVVMSTHLNRTPKVVMHFEDINGEYIKTRKVFYNATGGIVKEINFLETEEPENNNHETGK